MILIQHVIFIQADQRCNSAAYLPLSLALKQAAPPSHRDIWRLPNPAVHQLAVSLLTWLTVYIHIPEMQIDALHGAGRGICYAGCLQRGEYCFLGCYCVKGSQPIQKFQEKDFFCLWGKFKPLIAASQHWRQHQCKLGFQRNWCLSK